jgi:hypothetical protein
VPSSVFFVLSAFFLPVLSVFSAPLNAQSIRAEGRVVRSDSTPGAGARVVLHQIGRAVQAPLDSATADRRGRFRFSFRPDTSALYLLSARYSGIEYFSPPVHTNPARPDTAIRIVVYDTSSSAPIKLEARHLVITRPGEDGSRSVLDFMILQNDGRLTRVSRDSLEPSWSAPLPPGTLGLELGEGDFSSDAVSRRNDSLILTAPLAPGEKQLTVQYAIPSDRAVLDVPFGERASNVNILAEENGVQVSGGSLAVADSQTVQGRSFRRWTGDVPTRGVVRVVLPGGRRPPRWLLAALVGVVVLALGAGGYVFIRPKLAAPVPSSEELFDSIAGLDARYLDREGELPEAEWRSYQTERARLKTQLEASLAAGGRSR